MAEVDVAQVVSELVQRAFNGGLRCVGCSSLLDVGGIRMYPHSRGYLDPKTGERYWVYVVCRSCGYENAAWKLLSLIP